MSRSLIAQLVFVTVAAALGATASAQIFPEQFGGYTRSSPKTMVAPDLPLYQEYGLEATEQADYSGTLPGGAKRKFSIAAWRMHDATGSFALFQYRRPPGAVPSDFSDVSVRTSDGVIFTFGNYVLQITGDLPQTNELSPLFALLPKLENSALPPLLGYMPKEGVDPNSERYILGPIALQKFAPGIPPSSAAFRLGAEAENAKYQSPKGLISLTLFAYPTPSMAREQATEFQKIPGAMVKRTGYLLAVILNPADADAAERLLGKINYQASVTLNEQTSQSQAKGLASMILNIFVLAGIVLGLCVIGGVGFAGYRLMSRKLWRKDDPNSMIVLGIDSRPGK
jgi:hypothetical protein